MCGLSSTPLLRNAPLSPSLPHSSPLTCTQVVLAGDPHQLGPILASHLASTYGMGLSLLERLMERPAYQRDKDKFSDHGNYDPLMVGQVLCNNN